MFEKFLNWYRELSSGQQIIIGEILSNKTVPIYCQELAKHLADYYISDWLKCIASSNPDYPEEAAKEALYLMKQEAGILEYEAAIKLVVKVARCLDDDEEDTSIINQQWDEYHAALDLLEGRKR